MVYASLGYLHSCEPSSQKVHVHKSLQIEGKTAVTISHHYMLPFRRDSLLLSNIKENLDSDSIPSLALNETSILIISANSCSEVPLQLLSMSFDVEDDDSCTIQPQEEEFGEPVLHVPREDFKMVFAVIPKVICSMLKMGTVSLKWQRNSELGEDFHSCAITSQVTKHGLSMIEKMKIWPTAQKAED
ncbi:unnamed protein product [Fraxinus pennsylvanica]|uniref:Uncharacterized protein n=1 Tax=Fraxinus pennsylvanica TaxID=56036 RepID=A0AAD2A3R8_9LAMI|nr:unnamed protein product [Fraxinus pennsylvanica]